MAVAFLVAVAVLAAAGLRRSDAFAAGLPAVLARGAAAAGAGMGSGSGVTASGAMASASAGSAAATPIVLDSVRWQVSHVMIVRTSVPS